MKASSSPARRRSSRPASSSTGRPYRGAVGPDCLNPRLMAVAPHLVAAGARPQGQLELICGPMFSGKSEELMRRLRRVGYARKHAILVQPAIDDRYSVDEGVSPQ